MEELTQKERDHIAYYRSIKRRRPEHVVAPKAGQESVWDYPRPPAVQPEEREIRVEVAGILLVRSRRSLRVLETASPPVYYFPQEDIQMQYLVANQQHTLCEWKGRANYWDLKIGDKLEESVAWTYPFPLDGYEVITDYLAFYAAKMDRCFVGDMRVSAQAGGFYGGWITPDVVGPFKGDPGTLSW